MSDSAFKPYIPASESPLEMTFRALFLGSLLGIIFAASSVYLVLKIGMTVSASVPISVLSITLFKWLAKTFNLRPATILENNIVQTTGSAGESLAFCIGITMPTFLLMGMEMDFIRAFMVALLGGLLGVLMMIPLRRSLIVEEHGKLSYPEGTACADVLIVGEQSGTDSKLVFLGLGIGVVYSFLQKALKLFVETPERTLSFFKGASVGADVYPEMLGVGYIIGFKTSATMMAGGILSFLVLIPMIAIFGESIPTIMFPGTTLIKDMDAYDIRNAYVLYIGAGAVATGGIISLARSVPTIVSAFKRGFKAIKPGTKNIEKPLRTEQDLSMKIVLGGTIAILIAIVISPVFDINIFSAILIILFGFFFATVSSRITGEIGSSSCPISGMTVATLLITCLLFLAVGWTGSGHRAMALVTAAIVCVAASNAGTISQDLKTGYLVGATPSKQQIAIAVGVITSAIFVGFTIDRMNSAFTTVVKRDYPAFVANITPDAHTQTGPDGKTYKQFHLTETKNEVPTGTYLVDDSNKIRYLVDPGICGTVSKDDNGNKVTKLDSPKSRLFNLIIDGILTQKLPWGLVLVGVMLTIMMELVGVSALPFAVGIYLPFSASVPVFIGGIVRYIVDKRRKKEGETEDLSPGMLMATGLVAGGCLTSVIIAFIVPILGENGLSVAKIFGEESYIVTNVFGSNWLAISIFGAMTLWLLYVALKSEKTEI